MARKVFSNLANKNRSWKRMSLLVDLAFQDQHTSTSSSNTPRTAVDIGTDHGLLALGLAASGKFDKVVGIDVSQQALDNGGLRFENELRENLLDRHLFSSNLPVAFRCGSGLSVLEPGEADIVCIAGMGSRTILDILSTRSSTSGAFLLDELGCQSLILQPTNSRPRNLSEMYQALFELGWMPADEQITYIPTRWYLTTIFHRSAKPNDHSDVPLPCSKLKRNGAQFATLQDYACHHQKWLRNLQRLGKSELHPLEYKW
eukprot:CAMPEP_0168721064 /NCGR_PEP_ID=MMETSP0724-20121128/1891_1 /TAXON_ID=265536 /ORGANISM="Amphiprora sp., Strain CCMP467" /LENGTH=258 /DNA_ID=CAMNT_0008767697 /DNA_START=168 /DNA_END=941 /DNA_ORIENTATION=-